MAKFDTPLAHPITGDLLRSLFLASAHTSKKNLREEFLACLDRWLDAHEGESEYRKQYHDFLASEGGTPLEPMVLEQKDIDLATRFVRLAFLYGGMDTGSEEALLIGSRDAIGSGGGAYLKKQCQPKYIERFPFGKKTPITERTWFFSPQYENEALGDIGADFFENYSAKLIWENGSIKVVDAGHPMLNWQISNQARFLDDLKRHSSIGKNGEGFGRFGLSVEVENNFLIVKPEKPESMLRLSAMMAQDEILILDPEGSPHGTRGALCVQLSEPSDEGFEFRATVHSRSNALSSWVSLPVLRSAPDIDAKIVRELLSEFASA